MKTQLLFCYLGFLLIVAVVPAGCKKTGLPVLITGDITNITRSGAICRSNITSDGGSEIISRGICWSKSPEPTTRDFKTNDGPGAGNFSSILTALEPGTRYYVRAYAINTEGTAYSGNVTSFSTNSENIVIPVLTTIPVTDISFTGARSGGNITYDGGSEIIVSGVCWSTSQFPTIANNRSSDGSDSGSYSSVLKDLTPNSTYYIRSYATNIAGTGYGSNIEKFVTPGYSNSIVTVSDIDGNVYKTVTIGAQTWMAENLKVTRFNDGTPIPNISDATRWTELKNGAYCNFNNEIANSASYGCMYNFYAISDRHICPTGWHVPTDSEWTSLEIFLGYASPTPGGNLKEAGNTHWISPNVGADNSSGFTALPGGYRDGSNGRYYYLGIDGYWWTSSEYYSFSGFCRKLVHYDAGITRTTYSKNDAFSIRCIKD